MAKPKYVAAIDLGSNSFHLVVMKRRGDQFLTVDYRKDILQLSAGVSNGFVTSDTRRRALRCLRLFNRRLKKFKSLQVCAVGTSAFRHLNDQGRFLNQASLALGYPIRILTGNEEARYIYMGVASCQPEAKRFVFDVGGGSTELIYGEGRVPKIVASVELGCITLTHRFFTTDVIHKEQLDRCIAFIDQQLTSVLLPFQSVSWEEAMGTSGTIKAVGWAMKNLGIAHKGILWRDQLDRLLPVFTQIENQRQLSQLLELSPRRVSVFVAGYLVMFRVFHVFELEKIQIANQAIREGLITEMVAPYTICYEST